ncbi:MAG: GAF domain-containing protein [Desulfobacterales bacterium]|nr:GAF domain-containing protein [Desulfobacterales bacterium]
MQGSGEVQKQRRFEQTIAVLYEISNSVSHTRNLQELFSVIHRSLEKILCATNFFIALHDGREDSLYFPYYVNERFSCPEPIPDFSGNTSPINRVIRSGSPKMFLGEDCRDALQRNNGLSDCRIWLGAPLIVKGRVRGVMGVQDYGSEDTFDEGDLNLLNSVSQHVALAIERKESETRIREQGNILEKILEASPVGIALVENRVFKWVNSEMVRMFGYPDKSALENKSVKLIYADASDFEFAGKTIYEGLSTRGKADYEMDLIRKDQSRFPVHVRLNSTNSKDPMSWTIGTFTDISGRRAAEKERFEKERLQGVLEMAGAVCHEINQPLQAIIGYSELLQLDLDTQAALNSIHSIRSQAGRLGKITTTLANITEYKTVSYPGNTKIVDIWGAGRSS